MASSRWREAAREVIAEIRRDNPDADEKTFRKLVSDAYPFGQRAMHPYKIWCDEVKRQMFVLFERPRMIERGVTENLFAEPESTLIDAATILNAAEGHVL